MIFFDSILSAVREKVGKPDLNLETPRDKSFGDFATNAPMQLAKIEGRPPREIADALVPKIQELDFVESASVAGAGFINIKLRDGFIVEFANKCGVWNVECGVGNTENRPIVRNDAQAVETNINSTLHTPHSTLTIVMDYGAYNVAKAMHIGHLRTSIVGDTLCRIAKFFGHRPISYNHMGDWGKPMATVIAWIIRLFPDDWNKPEFVPDTYGVNKEYYPTAANFAKENPEFLSEVLRIKKEFQDGHAEYFALYEKILKISLDEMNRTVARLNILPFDNNLGERNAAGYLEPTEKILREKNMLVDDAGAVIIPVKRDDDTAPMPPLMFYDSRGADTYDSTDLATIYYRKITDNPDLCIYITDFRQNLHFKQLFRASDMAGMIPLEKLEHIGYGTINGKDGRPFKTRDGTAAALNDIIELTEEAAHARVAAGEKKLPEDTIKMIALAALKFNDLMHDVKSDYIFDPAAVTSFEGRTGPYILYTAVRLNSALKKSVDSGQWTVDSITNNHERDLLLKVLDFPKMIQAAFDKRAPDILANYTYELCQLANGFYHNCPIKDDANRVTITKKTADTLSTCIDLMGLRIPDEM